MLSGLDPAKAEQLGVLLSSLADADLSVIAPALQAGLGVAPAHQDVKALLDGELADRRLRDRVFAPLAPLLRLPASGTADDAQALSPETVPRLWRRLKREDAARVDAESADLSDAVDPQRARSAADRLTSRAAELIGDADASLTLLLRLCPLARATLPRLRNYIRTASDEHAAALRLAYRDAAAIDEDAPPRLIDILAAHLEQPWHALRLVCAVMDRPSDLFLAGSELGRFGEVVLDEVDQRIHTLRSFAADQGRAAGAAAAQAVCGAVQALTEFDRCLELSASGAWAKRIVAQRSNLARATEARLRQADGALARALPTGGLLRAGPNLEAPVDDRARVHAEALIAFAVGVRGGADGGGFTVARAKAIEALDRRLVAHADDLVRIAHDDPGGAGPVARERLDLVADLLGALRDAPAAELVRRRAAAA